MNFLYFSQILLTSDLFAQPCLEISLKLPPTKVSLSVETEDRSTQLVWMSGNCEVRDAKYMSVARYHVDVFRRPQSSTSCDRVNRDKDIIQVFSSLSSHTVKCHECNLRDNALRHCKPVQCITYCHRDFGGYQRSVLHSI